jgi:hypothetical protein
MNMDKKWIGIERVSAEGGTDSVMFFISLFFDPFLSAFICGYSLKVYAPSTCVNYFTAVL